MFDGVSVFAVVFLVKQKNPNEWKHTGNNS